MAATAPSWDDLRVLRALARHADAARAARELGVSVSTVYRRVGALEARLGVRCLARSVGSTELTESGRVLAAAADRMDHALTTAIGDVRDEHDEIAGSVSLTTVEGVAPLLTAPLAALRARHPGVRVDLHLGDYGPSVRRLEVDVAIGIMHRPPPDCWGRRLFRFGYGVFGTAEVVEGPARWVTLGPSLAYTPEAQWEVAHADPVAVTVANRVTFTMLVRAGVGLGLLPRPLAALHPELVEVRRYRPQTSSLARVAWVLTHESRRSSRRVSALTSTLVEHLARL